MLLVPLIVSFNKNTFHFIINPYKNLVYCVDINVKKVSEVSNKLEIKQLIKTT